MSEKKNIQLVRGDNGDGDRLGRDFPTWRDVNSKVKDAAKTVQGTPPAKPASQK